MLPYLASHAPIGKAGGFLVAASSVRTVNEVMPPAGPVRKMQGAKEVAQNEL